MAKYLIQRGADIKIKDETEWSALMHAVECKLEEIACLLVQKGADIHEVDLMSEESVLEKAKKFELKKLTELLKEKGAK